MSSTIPLSKPIPFSPLSRERHLFTVQPDTPAPEVLQHASLLLKYAQAITLELCEGSHSHTTALAAASLQMLDMAKALVDSISLD